MTKPGRIRYSFAIQFTQEGEWNRSEIGSSDLNRVLSHAFTALEAYAKSGFFPAVKVIKVAPSGPEEANDAPQV